MLKKYFTNTCLYFYCVVRKWTPEEDKLLLEVVGVVGLGNWARGTLQLSLCSLDFSS